MWIDASILYFLVHTGIHRIVAILLQNWYAVSLAAVPSERLARPENVVCGFASDGGSQDCFFAVALKPSRLNDVPFPLFDFCGRSPG
jgi:hypothetical protein